MRVDQRSAPHRSMLTGRRRECGDLLKIVETARSGRTSVLVLRGRSGVGKSALMGYVADAAQGFQVSSVAGVLSQRQFTYAALQDLCAALVNTPTRLPAADAATLDVLLGMRTGRLDEEQVGSTLLALLVRSAEKQPQLCLVDNAQWLDPASARAVLFAARQLETHPVAILLATQEDDAQALWRGLPQLDVGGLSPVDSAGLLQSALKGPLDHRVRARIFAESRGNPSALLQTPRDLSAEELAFGAARPAGRSLDCPGADRFRTRLASLPERSRRLVLIAAAEPLGDPGLLWPAATRLGIGVDAAVPVEEAELLSIGEVVCFRHPLLRSVACRSASLAERQAVHAALAEATDPGIDPDRWAWHRAQAVSGPDEDIAAALERSAGRARAHGGLIAVAILRERAAALTPHPADRAQRQLDAAHVLRQAGMAETAANLVVLAERGPLNGMQRARLDVLRELLRLGSNQADDALRSLVASLRRMEARDTRAVVDSYLEAFVAVLSTGRVSATGITHLALAARAAPLPTYPSDERMMLEAVALHLTDELSAAAPVMRRALKALAGEDAQGDGWKQLWLACVVSLGLWDFETWDDLTTRHLDLARSSGAVIALPHALTMRAHVDLFAGDLRAAASRVDEAHRLEQSTDASMPPYGAMALAAFRGRRAEAASITKLVTGGDALLRDSTAGAAAAWAEAVLANGTGQYSAALEAGQRAAAHPVATGLGPSCWALAELVEGAARVGDLTAAAAAHGRLAAQAAVSGTDWAAGLTARSAALLAEGSAAHDCFQEAATRLRRAGLLVEAARTQLLYGEWLRRAGRRREAREQLRPAHDFLSGAGVAAFAHRAGLELAATGEKARRRTVEARAALTAQELHIARLAAAGRSNPGIAAELFLSPRTVEWHMGKVLTKLGITARRQLRAALERTTAGDGLGPPDVVA